MLVQATLSPFNEEMSTNTQIERDPKVDRDWEDLARQWNIRSDTCYLNHGSFGISPTPVSDERRRWIERLDCQPMDFYLRQLEPGFHHSRHAIAKFLNTQSQNLVFVENATYGMNIVANSLELKSGDEVLLTDHEYGAVHRIWERRCHATDSVPKIAKLEFPFRSAEQVEEDIFSNVSSCTRLIVISHITSQTGTILPVQRICDRARQSGIAVCIDGPHAPAQIELDLQKIGCDFYTASCHKWLCAPLGTGFLYAAPKWQSQMEPLVQSWGRLAPNEPQRWDEEMIWMGTRDPSGFFSIPKAIEFLEDVGLNSFRNRTHWLANEALFQLKELFQTDLIYPASRDAFSGEQWFGSMCEIPLPERLSASDIETLQISLWQNHGIEVPVFSFEDRHYLRVSFHLYNTTQDIDRLLEALKSENCVA